MPRKNARERILDAAEEVVLEVGAGHMTLDAAAKKAGISKGGLIYNFPTKEALLQAMIERYVLRMKSDFDKQYAKLPDSPDREIKAYILSVLDQHSKEKHIGTALVAAGAHNPELLDPARVAYREMLEMTVSGPHRERLMVVSLATNGILLMELLGMRPFAPKDRKAVFGELLNLAEEGTRTKGQRMAKNPKKVR